MEVTWDREFFFLNESLLQKDLLLLLSGSICAFATHLDNSYCIVYNIYTVFVNLL